MSYNSDSAAMPDGALCLRLETAEAMLELGAGLGRVMSDRAVCGDGVRAVLLHGPLGAGKTTLTRGFVSALPGSDQAEVSSPSFTLCNVYPTRPPVLHCDLYRSGNLTGDGSLSAVPVEVEEALDDETGLVLVEWAEYLPAAVRPVERLDIFFQVCKNIRAVLLVPHGPAAGRTVAALAEAFPA